MRTELRRGTIDDASQCGAICFQSFKGLADRHGFEPDFPSVEFASGLFAMCFVHPGFYGVVATRDESIVGSNFLDERSQICWPYLCRCHGTELGRRPPPHATRARPSCATCAPRARLVQHGYNNQSLCLYTSLGFVMREPLSLLGGSPINLSISGYAVRPATRSDIEPCNRLCRRIHGHDRAGELAPAIHDGSATVVERLGWMTGYATSIGIRSHAVGDTTEDLMALIGTAKSIIGSGFLVPTRNQSSSPGA